MHKETSALHAGYEKDSQGTMAVPIYMSTAYEFKSTEYATNLFSLTYPTNRENIINDIKKVLDQ